MIFRVRTYNRDPGSLAFNYRGHLVYVRLLHMYPIWKVEQAIKKSRVGQEITAWGRRRWP